MRYEQLFRLLAACVESANSSGGFGGLTVLQAKELCRYRPRDVAVLRGEHPREDVIRPATRDERYDVFHRLIVCSADKPVYYLTGKSRKWWLDQEPKTEEEA